MQNRLPCRHCGYSVVLPFFKVQNLIERRDLPLCSACWKVRDRLKEPSREVIVDIMRDCEMIAHSPHVPAGEVVDLILDLGGAEYMPTPAGPRTKQQTQQRRQTVGTTT